MRQTSHSPKIARSQAPASVDDFIRVSLEKQFSHSSGLASNGGLHSFFMKLMEKRLILIVLENTQGNQSKAAGILGINRNTLRKKIEEYDVLVKKNNLNDKVMDS
ncbi:MAG: Fis family transcriptional regulator [Nitrospinota bacterium]|nr:Fis family transcriptional regulator [Nitrospinota bacterium]